LGLLCSATAAWFNTGFALPAVRGAQRRDGACWQRLRKTEKRVSMRFLILCSRNLFLLCACWASICLCCGGERRSFICGMLLWAAHRGMATAATLGWLLKTRQADVERGAAANGMISSAACGQLPAVGRVRRGAAGYIYRAVKRPPVPRWLAAVPPACCHFLHRRRRMAPPQRCSFCMRASAAVWRLSLRFGRLWLYGNWIDILYCIVPTCTLTAYAAV